MITCKFVQYYSILDAYWVLFNTVLLNIQWVLSMLLNVTGNIEYITQSTGNIE